MAVLLVCVTFPLIFVGGLVTTYEAGMAVPDWPSTYGYNLLLYPWQTWLWGPWDLFIEHGHRLLAVLVGLLTIALVVVVFCCERRRWVKAMSLAALAGVIAQGLLGGARVLLDQRTLAMIHGCFGPAFFALCVALAVFTSQRWRESAGLNPKVAEGAAPGVARLKRIGLATLGLTYLQIVLGAQLRHVPIDASPYSFRTLVVFHVAMALVLAGHAVALALIAFAGHFSGPALYRPALALVGLIFVQMALGFATWMVNYSWPDWDSTFPFAAGYTIQAGGMLQANVVTSHVAVGSLILATSTTIAVRSLRLLRSAVKSTNVPRMLEAVA